MSSESSLHLPGEQHILPTRDALFEQLAQTLISHARAAVNDRGVFHLALSGGSTPEPFYAMLVTDTRWRDFPWEHTHLWQVDERRVPQTDDKSNMKMIRESLTDHITIRSRQIHTMPVMEGDAADLYEKQLEEAFGVSRETGDAVPRLDFVLLGMGDDAHTASIFPHSPAVEIQDRWVYANEGEHVTPPPRLTLTYPLLNRARHLAVLLSGAKKAPTLERIAAQLQASGPDPANMPITGIQPESDATLAWYMDQDASGQ